MDGNWKGLNASPMHVVGFLIRGRSYFSVYLVLTNKVGSEEENKLK